MYKKLILVALLCGLLALVAACGGNGNGDEDVADTPDEPAVEDPVDVDEPDDEPELAEPEEVEIAGDRDFVSFTWYLNYEWAPTHTWGEDSVSAHLRDLFQIHAYTDAPDATADEVMNLMIMAGDLPDVIWMERDALNVEMTRMNLFYSIDELVDMVDNNWYHENVPASTQNHYAVDGVNHVIPNWVRMGEIGVPGGATGGNWAWMKDTNAHEAVGSPELVTFEDLYDFAVAVRDAELVNHAGAPMIPVLFNGGPNFAHDFVNIFFLAMGGMAEGWGGWYGIHPDGTYGTKWDNPVWRDAVMEANRWFREGLFPATNLTHAQEQFEENLTGGRGALIWHDHSVDNAINFRSLVQEHNPGNSIEIIYHDVNGHAYLYLPARGLSHSDITHQVYGTLGWNGNFITRQAEHPGRIFELLTWFLTPRGAIEWTMGPQGYLWEELDANGFPIMITSLDELTAEERSDLGVWRWDQVGHANHVDNAKFAANAGLPSELRNWVDYMQATLFTPNLIMSDEFQLIDLQIDGTEPLGIARAMIEDHFEEMLPQVILAETEEEANRMFDAVVAFAFDNGMDEIEEIYDAHWRANKELQGGSIFSW